MDIRSALARHVRALSVDIGARMSGTPGNAAGAEYIADALRRCGCGVEWQPFAVPAWTAEGAWLTLDGWEAPIAANPYSPACDARGTLVCVGTLGQLEDASCTDSILVLHGDLVRAPLAPKAWMFKGEHDERVIALAEAKAPAGLITLQANTGELERLTEDADLHIPSATAPCTAGLGILDRTGRAGRLTIAAETKAGRTANVVGRLAGSGQNTIVVCAHYDTKIDTPGACDNATGVACMLALAEALSRRKVPCGLEFVAFTNEEYLPIGDDEYVRRRGDFGDIVAAFNIDGVGQSPGVASVTLVAGTEPREQEMRAALRRHRAVVRVEPWPESNHSTFAWRGVPSFAFTSRGGTNRCHLRSDTIEWVDFAQLDAVVALASELVEACGAAARP